MTVSRRVEAEGKRGRRRTFSISERMERKSGGERKKFLGREVGTEGDMEGTGKGRHRTNPKGRR